MWMGADLAVPAAAWCSGPPVLGRKAPLVIRSRIRCRHVILLPQGGEFHGELPLDRVVTRVRVNALQLLRIRLEIEELPFSDFVVVDQLVPMSPDTILAPDR